jgi:hypothetical protein
MRLVTTHLRLHSWYPLDRMCGTQGRLAHCGEFTNPDSSAVQPNKLVAIPTEPPLLLSKRCSAKCYDSSSVMIAVRWASPVTVLLVLSSFTTLCEWEHG